METLQLTSTQARDLLIGLAQKYQRVAITGAPGTGKTTLALAAITHQPAEVEVAPGVVEIRRPLYDTVTLLSSDSGMAVDFKAQEPALRKLVEEQTEPCIVEGVTVARSLRHGLWVDAVVVLVNLPHRPQSEGARRLGASVARWVYEARDTYAHPADFYFVSVASDD